MSESIWPEDKVVFSQESHPSREQLHGQIAAMGRKLNGEQFERAVEAVGRLYEAKNTVSTREIGAIIEEIELWPSGGWRLIGIRTMIGSDAVPTAEVILKNPDGSQTCEKGIGNSCTDAIYTAIQHAANIHIFLKDFTYGNITSGVNALGKATVTVEHHGMEVAASAYSIDILEASAKAFLIAINIIAEKCKLPHDTKPL